VPSGADATARPTVALDGFGAERGFDVLAAGARIAAADGIRLRVFGPPAELSLHGADGIEVIPTSECITNEDDPVGSVRTRPEASVVRAAADVSDGNAAAMASVGSTGATMAAATFGLRRLRGVRRPALAARLPLPAGAVLLLDVGANVEARGQHLIQFAFLGAAFSSAVLDVAEPRVALLSNGEESSKGTPIVVEAHQALATAPGINFIGNVEGTELGGAADVVVTDGFTGNVTLKTIEGTAKMVGTAIRDAARSNPIAAAGGLLMRRRLVRLREELDPDATGGAILLGLRHPVVVGHGKSGPEGVANVVRLAARCVEQNASRRTEELLRSGHATRGELAGNEGRTAPVQA
jgi:glycerol-3-phosphate acyltransferase PlsX